MKGLVVLLLLQVAGSLAFVDEKTSKIKLLFDRIDADQNGKISFPEVEMYLKNRGLRASEKEIAFFFYQVYQHKQPMLDWQDISSFWEAINSNVCGDIDYELALFGIGSKEEPNHRNSTTAVDVLKVLVFFVCLYLVIICKNKMAIASPGATFDPMTHTNPVLYTTNAPGSSSEIVQDDDLTVTKKGITPSLVRRRSQILYSDATTDSSTLSGIPGIYLAEPLSGPSRPSVPGNSSGNSHCDICHKKFGVRRKRFHCSKCKSVVFCRKCGDASHSVWRKCKEQCTSCTCQNCL